jgi:ankyrin repeat protein
MAAPTHAAGLQGKIYLVGHGPVLPAASASAGGSSSGGGKRRSEQDVMFIARKLLRCAPSQRALVLNARNRDGDTLLHACAKAGHSEVVATLLTEGSPELDIDARNPGGFTPLAFASRGGFQDICAQLVAAGADTSLLFGKDQVRFQPVREEKRPLVREAVKVGRVMYARRLAEVLLHGCDDTPFATMPEVLVGMVVAYVLGDGPSQNKPGERQSLSKRSSEEEKQQSDSAASASAASESAAAAADDVVQPLDA